MLFRSIVIYFTSLYSYSANDPGFNQLNYNINDSNIENLMGFFGAYLSSYSLIFIGTLSYLLAFFIILEGVNLFLGITSRFIFLKFLSNLTGIILINISIKSLDISFLKTGLVSQFLIDLFTNINLNILENIFIYFIINFLLLVFGVVLIFLSFRINFSWINKLFSFLKLFKYFKFLFSVFEIGRAHV